MGRSQSLQSDFSGLDTRMPVSRGVSSMARKSSENIKDQIKDEHLLAEVQTKGYEYVQLHRVNYWKGRNSYIDVRTYNTNPADETEPRFPTKRGVRLREKLFLDLFGSAGLLPLQLLHPSLRRAYKKLAEGETEDAVFEAFKRVEMHVRKASGFGSQPVGVKLMRKAFDPTTGPLRDHSAPLAEREAEAHLFAGAIGAFKNPGSHRAVAVRDGTASRLLVFAGLLLGIVDQRSEQ